ncbi:MAG: biopolymer transporter ExbD [Akkermansiaceae bacterium]|nr:biopolymer transporter ExbD [Akkermansiaceae bacterium]
MTLTTTLPERPGFLHAIPVLDLFLMIVLFFMVAPSLILQSGVTVEPPPSKFQMERFQDTLVITLGAGQTEGNIHFGRRPVTFEELEAILDSKRVDGSAAKAVVLLQTAADIPVRAERKVAEMIIGKGFRLALVGRGDNNLRAVGGEEDPEPGDEP